MGFWGGGGDIVAYLYRDPKGILLVIVPTAAPSRPKKSKSRCSSTAPHRLWGSRV